jgi:Ribbon-helix-helix protein, copG family
MALLDKDNLAIRMERARKHRINHVGTKLNEAELQAFDALAEKRQQTHSELIRELVLREIEAEGREHEPSVELVEIAALRLLLINLFHAQVVEGVLIPETAWTMYQEETRKRKREAAERELREYERTKGKLKP